MEEKKLEILLNEYSELRDELKQRIEQRDNFSVQFIVACCAVLALTVSMENGHVATLLPLITIFFATQIFESYRVHERLVEFIRDTIEKGIADLVGEDFQNYLWETHCRHVRDLTLDGNAGGRKRFFQAVLVIMPIGSLIIHWYLSELEGVVLLVVCLYYLILEVLAVLIVGHDLQVLSYTGLNKYAYCDYLRKADRTDEPTKAVFFDKDGTLHEDRVMTHRWRDLRLLPYAKEAVKYYHNEGYLVIIVTNQSAIGKGIYSVQTMHRFIWLLRRKLKYVDAVYYCPHKYGVQCSCRKPGTGMFERAVQELNVDLSKSIMVGDRMSDIKAGINAGVGRNVLIRTGLYNDSVQGDECYESIESLHELLQSAE